MKLESFCGLIPWSLLALISAGCASSNWSRQTVDGAGADTGRWATMQFHAKSGSKRLTLVYEDTTSGAIKAAQRVGSSAGWEPFSLTNVFIGDGRLPTTTKSPSGKVYTAFLVGGYPAGPDGTLRVAWQDDRSSPANWVTERVRTGIRGFEPPTLAYLPAGASPSGADSLHLVYRWTNGILAHSFRRLEDVEWTHLNVGATFDNPTGNSVEGIHPILVVSGVDPHLTLFYGADAAEYPLVHRGFSFFLGGAWPPPEGNTGWHAASTTRLSIKTVEATGLPPDGLVGMVKASCSGPGLLKYRESTDAIPSGWSGDALPTIPVDTSLEFCDPSFAFDALGLLYISFYHRDARRPAAYVHNPSVATAWQLEFIDGVSIDVGRHTCAVYDPLAKQILVSYYDAINGNLRLATRNAN